MSTFTYSNVEVAKDYRNDGMTDQWIVTFEGDVDLSYGELAELQSLRDHIDLDDLTLLQWAGVPEVHLTAEDDEGTPCAEVTCLECRRSEQGEAA